MSYMKFDWEDKSTHPPADRLVLTHTGYGYDLRQWDGEDWRDRDGDLDDGIEPGDEISWDYFPKDD